MVSITEVREERRTALPARVAPSTSGSFSGKRLLDLALAVPLCVVALPVLVVLAMVLAWQLRANPIFVHQRIGLGGRLVRIPKLRTLRATTPRYADKTEVVLEPPTRLTRVLRSSHLDELPQLFLVVSGHLSLVGPRPRMAVEALQHGDAVYEVLRTSIPQGCTGLWQISSGRGDRVSDHPEYDLFYMQHRTTLLDLWILWRTVVQTVGAPAIDLASIPSWALAPLPVGPRLEARG